MVSHFSIHKKAILALIVANIIWGAASPIFKYSLQNIPPFTLALLRFSIASLLLYPFVRNEFQSLQNEKKDIKSIIFFSLLGVTINISFFFLALKYTKSINAPIIGSSGPVFTLILSAYILKEKLKLNKIVGTLISFFGILVIIFEPLLETGIDGSILGNVFLLLATFGAVGQTIVGRKLTQRYPPLPLTYLCFAIGTVTFLPLALTELGHLPIFDIKAYVGIIFGAVFSSLIAYSLYIWGLSKIEASEVSFFAYIDPVVAVIIAYPLLNEKPTSLFLLGSLLVFLGIFIAEKRIHWHPVDKVFSG